MYRMAADIPSLLGVNGLALQDERVGQVAIDGALEVRSLWGVGKMNVGSARDMKPEPVVEMTRTIFLRARCRSCASAICCVTSGRSR